MSPTSDYPNEMPGISIADADVEALLTREEPSDPTLQELSAALERIDLRRLRVSVDGQIGVVSLRSATLARQAASTSKPLAPWWQRFGPKLATGAISVALLLGVSGVAAASDAAAPGDFLYGLDRSLEAIGINDGGLAERLDEAAAMSDEGEGLNHAADALTATSPQAADALLHAAEAVATGQMANEEVAQLLRWMATTEATGREFGNGVAERARSLGSDNPTSGPSNDPTGPPATRPEDTGEAPGNSDQAPGNSDQAPGNSDQAPGNSDQAPGNSDQAPGKSDEAPGKSGETPAGSQGNNAGRESTGRP